MKSNSIYVLFYLFVFTITISAQNIIPTPTTNEISNSDFSIDKMMTLAYNDRAIETANYLQSRLENHVDIKLVEGEEGDIVLSQKIISMDLEKKGYNLSINPNGIRITANIESKLFYGVQRLFQLLPIEIQAGKSFIVTGVVLKDIEIKDIPKYKRRDSMLDSGRQFLTPEFINWYLGWELPYGPIGT